MKTRLHVFESVEILVIEQSPLYPFNRGQLLNIGFLNSDQDYFIFHDVDMLPTKVDYSYPTNPTHIATRCSQFRYKMPYANYFGGVTLFNRADFIKVNGYSNNFWSWGCEDDEMRNNVLAHGLKIDRRLCTFESLWHKPEDRSLYTDNLQYLKKGRDQFDGLNHCDYIIEKTEDHGTFKKISVGLLPGKDRPAGT